MILDLIIITLGTIFVRLLYVVCNNEELDRKKRIKPAKTMICLGSGGHTTEIMQICKALSMVQYVPRYYILANSDKTSEFKIHLWEQKEPNKNYSITQISRSRNVRQSYLTAIFSTLYSLFNCIPILYRIKPDLILCNGPGTCVPICLIALLMKVFFINSKCKIVFIESFCRVKTLSLSGKILIWIADLFVVQWPTLKKSSTKVKYYGRLS